MIRFLDLYQQYTSMKAEIDEAVQEVIRDAAFIGGPYVARFEQNFAAYQQAPHCVGVGNGTDAIEIAIEALGLPAQSEVIVPANSFIASSEAVTRAGCVVRFADVRPDTYTVDMVAVERCITPVTSAILAVHIYGHPVDMGRLKELAERHGLKIIEDCAQAHGAEHAGRRVGCVGDIGTFSFYPGKNLGAYGDAGAIVCSDVELARRCRMIANHGRTRKYDHEFEGRNSRLDAIQAAILNVKLQHLDEWVMQRNRVARRYLDGLCGVGDLVLPVIADDVRHAFHLFVVRTAKRDGLADHLRAAGIETGVHYPIALPDLAAYAYLNGRSAETATARRNANEVLSLPIGEHLSDDDVSRVITEVTAFFS